MRRGDIVAVALPGDYGKPRPAIVIQANALSETDSVLVCPLTTTLRDTPLYRLPVAATPGTGLHRPSEIMVDKITALRRDRCGAPIGRIEDSTLLALDRLLALVVGIADGDDAASRGQRQS